MLNNRADNGETHGLSERGTGQYRGNPSDVELAWLAGILDGEGHIGFRLNPKKWGDEWKEIRTVDCNLIVSNTSRALIDKAHGIVFAITHRKPTITTVKKSAGKRNFDYFQMPVYKQHDIRKICEATLPYLTAKREQAKLMIEFCRIRESKAGIHNPPYGAEEFAVLAASEKFRRDLFPESLRRLMGLVETERPTPTARTA